MREIQQNEIYRKLLKAVPVAVSAYLGEIGVENARDVIFSVQRDKLEDFYPALRCLAQELDFSYDMDISLPETDDKAMALFELNGELLHQTDISSFFGPKMTGIDFSSGDTAGQLQDYKVFAANLPEENTEDKEKMQFWLKLLSSISKETTIQGNKNISADFYDDIEASGVAYEIANKVNIAPDDADRISLLNEVLFKACRKALDERAFPDSRIIAQQAFLSLENFDQEEHPDLKRLKTVISNCMPPLNELIGEYQEKYTQAGLGLRNILVFDDDMQKADTKTAAEIREIIFRQHLTHLRRIDNKFYTYPKQYESLPPVIPDPQEQRKVHVTVQKKTLRQFAEVDKAMPRWLDYERHSEISASPFLKNSREELIKQIFRQLISYQVDTNGNLTDLPFLIKFGNKVTTLIEEQEECDKETLSDILSLTDSLVAVAEAANKHLGTDFDTKLVQHDTLAAMQSQKDIYPDELDVISEYVIKFAQTCGDFLEKENSQQIDTDDFVRLGEKISVLPDSMEKMEMQELINIHTHLSFGSFYNYAQKRKEKSADFFMKLHQKEFRSMVHKLEAMAEFYPEVQEAGIEKIAKNINASVVHNVIFPFYKQEDDFHAQILMYNGENKLSDEAVLGLAKISGEFIKDTCQKHKSLLSNRNMPFKLLKELASIAYMNSKMESLEQDMQASSQELQAQFNIHNQYQEYKFARRKTMPSDEITKRLIIKNKMHCN